MSITVPLEGFGGGGGTSLNFDVKAYPTEETLLAATPKENTIGIITVEKITSWALDFTEPSAPAEGMVWITVGTESEVAFNALKKNAVQVYPIAAKQYVGGAWVDVTAMSYQNGEWVDWIQYLFDNGNVDSAAGELIVHGLASFSGTTIEGSSGTSKTSAFTFSQKINIGANTKLNVDLTQENIYGEFAFTFGLATSNTLVDTVRDVNNLFAGNAKKKVDTIGEDIQSVWLDVSAYTGQSMYVIGNGISDYSVRRIWLSR